MANDEISLLKRRLPLLTLSVSKGCAPKEARPDVFANKYDIGAMLGSGSVAVVKRATRRTDGEAVAVKIISTSDREMHQFARGEYDIMNSLHHESIVSVEDFHANSCSVWIVMELCQDGDLEAYRQSQDPFEEAHLMSLFQQLLNAVDYLHQKRIVHRDLKPANCVLKDSATKLKVTDFNSAKMIGQGDGSSLMLTFRGTRSFASPELVLGLIWNERVDIWTCGMILYFMVYGAIPFNCAALDVKERFATGNLPNVNWIGFGELLRNVALQCLAVDMRARPSAMELLQMPLFDAVDEERPASEWLDDFESTTDCSEHPKWQTSKSSSRRPPKSSGEAYRQCSW